MKKALLTVAILATCVAAMAQTRAVTGDVNGDGFVTTTDATMIYNYLLTGDQTFYSTSDVNGDGNVTIDDATLIQKAAADIIVLSDSQKTAADVDGDGRVTVSDATCVQKYIAKYASGTGAAGQYI